MTRVCYEEFGDRVKFWITLNEPKETSLQGHGSGTMAPGLHGLGTLAYVAAHNQIRAHARAYRAYQADFAASQAGKVGITLNVNWGEPRDPANPGDVEASETFLQFNMGWYGHAIFVDGKYPEVMRTQIDEKSAAQGFEESRLPHFSEEDSAIILGSSDFLGINFYTSEVVYPETSDISDVSFYADQDVKTYQDHGSILYSDES